MLLVRMQGICHFASLLYAVLTDDHHEGEHELGESLSRPGSFSLLQ